MEWTTVLLILGILAILGATVVGGKVKVSKDGLEYDAKGFLDWLSRAREEKAKQRPGSEAGRSGRVPEPTPSDIVKNLERARIPRARVLWVDDHPINNVFERQALASVGIFADSFTRNREAEQAMGSVSYDLVISDIMRDGATESGWDLVAVFRSKWPRVPFLFYVGNVDHERRERAQREGARGITADPDELVSLVAQNLATP